MSRRLVNENLPKMLSLSTKDRPLSEVYVRYANRRVGPDLYKVTVDSVDEPDTLIPFKTQRDANVGTDTQEPADDSQKPLLEASEKGTLPEATSAESPAVVVQVLLLKLPVVHTRFLYHRLELLTVTKQNRPHFYGGLVDADVDGADTSSHESLVNAAIRHLKAQAQLDLSSIPPSQWVRFATFHCKPALSTVFVMPKLWEADVSDELVARTTYTKDVTVRSKTVKTEYEEEEEVEEEIEQVVAGQEGETDEEKKTEKVKVTVKKPVKKTREEVVETKEVAIKVWGIPEYVSIDHIVSHEASWQMKLVTSLLIESMWRHAAALMKAAIGDASERAQKAMERKRKREEEAAESETRKKAKTASREEALALRVDVLQQKWKQDDEGKTEEEIKEAQAERAKEKEQLKTELQEQWKREDEDEAAEEANKKEIEMETDDSVKVATIDEDLLTACSLFDNGIHNSGYGACPSEDVSLNVIKNLFCSTATQSRHAVDDFLKATAHGYKLHYRVLTDILPTE